MRPGRRKRLRALGQDALAALGSPDLLLRVWVVDWHPKGYLGWSDPRGVYIVAGQLDLDDEQVRELI